MIIVYVSNFLNHHQKLVADILYTTEGVEYTFVETIPMYNWLKRGGYTDYSQEPYVLKAWENIENKQKTIDLVLAADIAIFSCPESLQYQVIRAKTGKLTFDVSERWLKRGWLNLASPRLLKYLWYYFTVFNHKRVYKLCSSAFACGDHYKLHSFKDKCYKWGYFTKVDRNLDVEESLGVSNSETLHTLMWCARFLKWKHPELPIQMAARLKEKGYKFVLDMYGSGKELEKTQALSKLLNVEDVVCFKGNMPNDEILKAMREHEIFLFTSDKNEGWGAVANESMSNGCAIVASDAIGSIPFLVNDGINGCIFESCNLNSLCEKVEWLLDNPTERKKITINAYHTMRDIWSPQNAANNFLKLVEVLQSGNNTMLINGPCSKAYPI